MKFSEVFCSIVMKASLATNFFTSYNVLFHSGILKFSHDTISTVYEVLHYLIDRCDDVKLVMTTGREHERKSGLPSRPPTN